MTWFGCKDKKEWADLHGYVRIHCRIHGQSWSDGGVCEACLDDGSIEIPTLDAEDEE